MTETIQAFWLGPARTRILLYVAAAVLGMAAASLIFFIPPMYLVFLAGGLIFLYLLFTKVEVAIIAALFLQNILGQFNYLGQGTPFHPNGLMGVALIAGAIWYFLFHKVEITGFRRLVWFLLFFLFCILSTLLTERAYFMDSLTVTLRLATSLSIFAVLLYRLDSVSKVKWVLGAIIAAQIYPTITGLLMYAGATGLSFTPETYRLGNSGVGIYQAIMLTLCLVFLLDVNTKGQRLLWGLLSLLYTLGLFFSFGRSGWISFLLVLLVIGILRHKWLLILAPLAVLLAVLLVPGLSERFADVSVTDVSTGSSTLAGRITVWQAALELLPRHPVFGVGIGVGRYVVGDYLHRYAGMLHNDYIGILFETGLVGLVLFALWHAEWLRSIFNVFRQAMHSFDRTLALAVFAVLLVSLVGRITDNILLDSYDMYPLCALAAATMALPGIRAKMEPGIG